VAATRGIAFAALMAAGIGLLIMVVAAVSLIALGAGILIVGNGGPHEERVLLGFLAIGSGLGLIWFAQPATLLGTRRLARLTRQLTGDWCGVPIAESYAPPPAGKLTYTERLRWLATDPATRRDLRWAAANLLVCALTVAPVAIIATGLIEFIGPEFTRLIPPPAFPGNTPRTLVVLALDTPARISLASELTGRPPAPVESARGTGLRGIERRLAAFDGVLAISSPPGGPTAVTMEIPCALSSPKTSSC
jgi:hypothetical protein